MGRATWFRYAILLGRPGIPPGVPGEHWFRLLPEGGLRETTRICRDCGKTPSIRPPYPRPERGSAKLHDPFRDCIDTGIEFGAESAKHLTHPNELNPFKIPLRLFAHES